MSDIQVLFDRLNDVEAELFRFARGQTSNETPAERMTRRSLERRAEELKTEINEIAGKSYIDLFDYRMMPANRGRYPVRGVAGALSGLQDMVTNFFGAVRDKPKAIARFDLDVTMPATMNVGYAYSGSLGFVLYVPNDQFLQAETDLDLAVRGIVELMDEQSVEGVKSISQRFGKSSIRSFYLWSDVHIKNDFDAHLKWQRGGDVKVERIVQRQELKRVRDLIDSASERIETPHQFVGVLSALDTTKRTFGFALNETAELLRGHVDPSFDINTAHKVPGVYVASLKKAVVHRHYTDEDIPTWTLVSLVEIPA